MSEKGRITMKKDELMKLEGMTESLADAIVQMSKDELENMVPKSRLNEVITERDNAKNAQADTLKQLNDLQKESVDIDTLKSKIKDLEDAAKETEKAHAAEMNTLKINNAVDVALNGAKALNVKAVKALLNLEGAKLSDDGTVEGLADQIKVLQEADDSKFLFGTTTMTGAQPGESGNEGPDTRVDTSTMTYSEMVAYQAEHPDAKLF